MPGPLLQTKFYMPPVRPNLISRPQLIERLNAGLGDGRLFPRRLSLVSAPAGFGKTTLVTNWIRHLKQAEDSHSPAIGWLSLDEGDNELLQFISYLVTAVQKADFGQDGEFGAELLAGLQLARPPDEAAILPALLNELTEISQPLLLILDDYHVITDEAIHALLTQLIDYLPPQVQLVITSREDPLLPLPRWRVRGQLTEIRAADLRFSSNEAADFLLHTMGLTLSDEVVARLESRTEGWVAGLQLAALSMQGATDPDQLVANFSGSERHVAGYLLEEVLHHQPEVRQRFLLETAVLERFNAAISDHLTGRNDSRRMLDTLVQNNLFVIPLDNQGEWYRYHHLFAQLLRHRLEREETAEQRAARHRIARAWFQEQGHMEEAIHHALKAGDTNWVADYLGRIEPTSLWEGRMAAQFKGWLNQLPTAVVETVPRLMSLAAWASLITTDVQIAEQWLWKLAGIPDLDETVRAEMLLMQAVFARNEGDNEVALELVSEALSILPEEQETVRMLAFMQVASASFNLGLIDKGHDVVRYVYDSVDTQTMAGLGLFLSAAQMLSIAMRGRLRYYEAMNILLHTLKVVEERTADVMPMVGLIYSELGRIHYDWNELDKAADYCQQTIELGRKTGISDLLFPAYFLDIQLARNEGDLKRLDKRLDWVKDVTRRSELSEIVGVADFIEASFRLEVGDVNAALRWADASGLTLDDEPAYYRFGHYLTLVRIFIAENGRQETPSPKMMAQINGMIDRLMALAQSVNDLYEQISLNCVKAIFLATQGDMASALDFMTEAIILAEPASMVRIFLDNGPSIYPLIREAALTDSGKGNGHSRYARRLLEACEQEWGAFRPNLENQFHQPMIDPLTEREREVLTCIVTGLSNREIEERLVISRNTVRTHLKNLYSKLGVNGREEAIEQGQLLGLV